MPEMDYREGEGPVLPPLRSVADIRSLQLDRLGSEIAPILQTVRGVRQSLAHDGFADCSLIGFAGGTRRNHRAGKVMEQSRAASFDHLVGAAKN